MAHFRLIAAGEIWHRGSWIFRTLKQIQESLYYFYKRSLQFQVGVCVETLCKYLDNIMQNPTEEKFRKIRKSNKAYQDRVACLDGTEVFLEAAGFRTERQEDQDFWVFPEDGDIDQLLLLKEALLGAEPIRAELDRGTKVLLPSQAQKPISLPPDFFNLTTEELKREQQLK